jgi:drug/metabolite transporter (DMT)-like permease
LSNEHNRPQRRQKPALPPALILVLGVFATSTSAILIRFAQEDAPSLAIAAGRLSLATLLLLPWAARRTGELRELSQNKGKLVLLSGFMLGLHFAAYISSVRYTSIAAATVLATSTPVWVGLASPFVLREPLRRSQRAGILLAVGGSFLIGLGASGGGSHPLLGNVLALSSALTGAVYFLIGRQLRPHFSLRSYTTIVYGCAALTLLLFTWIGGYSLLGYEPRTYLLFLLMALFPQLLGHSSYNYALAFLPAVFVSVAVISEPIGATMLGLLFFGEVPGVLTVVGGVLILAGVFRTGQRV